jgi:hypothetical protein
VREKNKHIFKVGDLVVQKRSKLGVISEVKDIGFPQHLMSIKKYNLTVNVYKEDYRLATEKDILESKLKNIFIK